MNPSTSIAAILLDIEGTTTPIDFVYKVLFPYARAHAGDYLAGNLSSAEVQADIAALLRENANDLDRGFDAPKIDSSAGDVSVAEIESYVHWLMDRDRKTTPLKSLQGKIWEAGYKSGDLRSEVFEDVPRAFKRWGDEGVRISIYSSGSVLAQNLLFESTQFGDLTSFISGYFDTNIGTKKDLQSYRTIADQMKLEPTAVLFASDVTEELDAATAAGMQAVLCLRPGNHDQPNAPRFHVIESFDELI